MGKYDGGERNRVEFMRQRSCEIDEETKCFVRTHNSLKQVRADVQIIILVHIVHISLTCRVLPTCAYCTYDISKTI